MEQQDRLVRRFEWDVEVSELPVVEEGGRVWVPFLGHQVSPELAERRRAARASGLFDWPDLALEVGYWVSYEPAGSRALSALGRLGR